MNILVTGATGFIGNAICLFLHQAGHKVTALVRDTKRYSLDTHVLHIDDIALLKVEHLSNIDVLIHTAGIAHNKLDHTDDYERVNVSATEHIAETCIQAGVARLIFLSSIKAVGEGSLKFDTPPAPQTPYGKSKLRAESVLQGKAAESSLQVVILRIALTIGHGAGGNIPQLVWLANSSIPLPFDGLLAERSYLSLQNLLDFVGLCLSHSGVVCEPLLLSDLEPIRLSTLIATLRLIQEKPRRIFCLSNTLLSYFASLLLGGASYKVLFENSRIDMSRTQTLTGWQPSLTTVEGLPVLLGKNIET